MLTDEISERTPVPAFDDLDRIAGELSWLCGQINVLQARVVELTAQVDEAGLLGATGCRSLSHWVSWKTGSSAAEAHGIAELARRRSELPKLTEAMAEGKVSLAQAAVVATRVPTDPAVDEHFTELAQMMTVAQLRTAVRIACPPTPRDLPKPNRFTFHHDDHGQWVAAIRADAATGAHIESGLRTHLDALHQDHALEKPDRDDVPPPTWLDALERMVDRSLEREASDRPWSQRTKVVVHVDAGNDVSRLHLGPALSAADRALLTCDGTLVTILERDGQPVSVGREQRITPPRTRLVIEDRDGGCVIPWCRRTRKLVTHHIVHWQHGGPTDTGNLVCLCPFHHRQVHAGAITITGCADRAGDGPGNLRITNRWGRTVTGASGSSPPEHPPDLGDVRYEHPHGAPMHWKWYSPPPLPDVT